MTFDRDALNHAITKHGKVARVLVAKTAGSVPREAGTSMLVWVDGQSGTIGGGALEWEAAKQARDMSEGESRVETIPLGPSLGQCCGGSVTLVTEVFSEGSVPDGEICARRVNAVAGDIPTADRLPILKNGWIVERVSKSTRPIWIYGAGHVGRALIATLSPLPEIEITWVDTSADRFPDHIPDNVNPLVAADPTQVLRHAPDTAEHLILTYSHEMDLALCHAVLSHRFRSVGLIGSATKWARFKRRLANLGHSADQIARIACPIGDPSLGKHPQEIAIGVAMAMLNTEERRGAMGTG